MGFGVRKKENMNEEVRYICWLNEVRWKHNMVWFGGVCVVQEVAFLGIYPVIDHGSSDVGEGGEYPVICLGHGVMGAINHFVSPELCPEFIC